MGAICAVVITAAAEGYIALAGCFTFNSQSPSRTCPTLVLRWGNGPDRWRHPRWSKPKLMPRVYVTSRGRSGVSFGCLGSLVVGFIYLMAAVLFIGVLMVVCGVFLAALIVSLLALGVQRLLLAVSPGYRARRAVQGPFRPTSKVIDSTAKVIASAKSRRSDGVRSSLRTDTEE